MAEDVGAPVAVETPVVETTEAPVEKPVEQVDNTESQNILGTEETTTEEVTGGEGELGGEETLPDIEFNSSDYGDSTTMDDESFKAGLTEIMGDNPSRETKEAVKKLLDKINDSHQGQLKSIEKATEENYDSIMKNPPVQDMAGLNTFINSNPELKDLAKTMTSAALPKEVVEANIKALDMIRSGSVKGAGNPSNPPTQTSGSGFTPEKIRQQYEDIVMTKDGHKRDVAIRELKAKASANADQETTEFINGFFI